MGKRKREQQQAEAQYEQYENDYAEDAAAAPYGAQASGGGSRVEADILSYLSEVVQHLASLENDEERELLVDNVLEEVQGKELRIATDAATSRMLEQLLAVATPAQLMQFLQAFTNEDMMFSLAGGAFGSHVAEKALAGLHAAAAAGQLDAEATEALQQLLGGMVGAVGAHLFDYVMDKHATHVARALLVVIAGRDVLPPAGKKARQQQQQAAEEGEDAGGGKPAFKPGKSALAEKLEGSQAGAAAGQVPVRFPDLLRRFVKMLPCYDAPNMALLGKTSYSSAFLQAMLRAAAGDEQLLMLLLPPLLGVDAAKAAAAAPGSVLAGVTDSQVGRLLRDDVYSRLLEVVVAVMPQQQQQGQAQGEAMQQAAAVRGLGDEFSSRFMRGRLLPLSNHHAANFVVQAWLAASSSPQRVSEALSELGPHLCDLLKRRRCGVLAALVAAAARAGPGPHQAGVLEALAAALSGLPQWQGRTGTDHLAPALMTLDTSATLGASQQQQQQHHHHGHSQRGSGGSGGHAQRLSTPGCALLSTLLLQFPRKPARPFAASVAALGGGDLAAAARDPSGSRVLQALVEGPAGQQVKAALLAKLAGSWGAVALAAGGSFFLEKAYAWADLAAKEAIVREVAARQATLLAGCYWGPVLAFKLGVEAYTRSPEEWRKRAAATAAASRAFESLLADEIAAGGGSSGKQEKLHKRRQQQEGQQQREGGAAAVSGGDSGGKELAANKQEDAGVSDAAAAAAADGRQQAGPAGKGASHKERKKRRKEAQPLVAGKAAAVQLQPQQQQQQETSGSKKRSKQRAQKAAASLAAGGGTTDDFVALLGFAGLGAAPKRA